MSVEDLTITRHENGKAGEYHAHLKSTDAIGRLTWIERDVNGQTVRVAEHTLVPRAIGGRGIAAQLVSALVADAREQGFKIVPQCSYVEKKFDQNPEWNDLRA